MSGEQQKKIKINNTHTNRQAGESYNEREQEIERQNERDKAH